MNLLNTKVGLIGWGIIGTGVSKLLLENKSLIAERSKVNFELKWIADLDIERDRGVSVSKKILTQDAKQILNDPEVSIVIELMGGYEPALSFIKQALEHGKSVVTANKALLAKHGKELFELAKKNNTQIRFEASVGGGIPIIKSLTEGFVGNKIEAIYGIVNGTSNFILTAMKEENADFETVLRKAQSLGYAEANPSFDIDGVDSAHKLTLLASLAYGKWIPFEKIYVEGIRKVNLFDIKEAEEFGYTIKLLAISKLINNHIQVRVHPTFVPNHSPLATVKGAFNAIYTHGDFVGESLQYGLGAGEKATASAVIADLVDVALKHESLGINFDDGKRYAIENIHDLVCKHYLRIFALDEPGVLAKITGILGENSISIESLDQRGKPVSGLIPVVIMTHKALESRVAKAQQEIDQLIQTDHSSVRIRVEEF